MAAGVSTLIYPKQIRAARGLLGITQVDLASLANIGIATVKKIESSPDEMKITVNIVLKIKRALEAKGIVFIHDSEVLGVGLRHSVGE